MLSIVVPTLDAAAGVDRTLRAASPGVRFVFLAIDPGEALQRVSRRPGHFFAPTLMDSQFAALEPPAGEDGVLCLDALRPLPQLLVETVAWLRSRPDNAQENPQENPA